MKVIGIDNFGRENYADTLVKENLSADEAYGLADELNKKGDDNSPRYYVAVPDDRRLSLGAEDHM